MFHFKQPSSSFFKTITGKTLTWKHLFQMTTEQLDGLFNIHTTCPQDQCNYRELLHAIETVNKKKCAHQ